MSASTGWETSPQQEVSPQEEIGLQGKLHIERLELSTKLDKLKNFVTMNPKFKELNYEHKELLEEQLNTMNKYENILVQRMILLNQPQISYFND